MRSAFKPNSTCLSQTLREKVPLSHTLREKVPLSQTLREKVPFSQTLREKVPLSQTVREKVPLSQTLREKARQYVRTLGSHRGVPNEGRPDSWLHNDGSSQRQ